jgi:hypothetical protein
VPLQQEAREVAISLSLWESLLLPLSSLHPLIRSYARRAYPAVQMIELEREESLYGHAECVPCKPRFVEAILSVS